MCRGSSWSWGHTEDTAPIGCTLSPQLLMGLVGTILCVLRLLTGDGQSGHVLLISQK